MHKAMLSESLGNARVQCNICQWRCKISAGKFGVCRVYKNQDGTLYNLNYALASSISIDPIEKKPLYHFYPGTDVFSLGSWGCNFHCRDCQNWTISCIEAAESARTSRGIPPEQAVQETMRNHCAGIAWTYNEPTMWFEYTLDSAKLARGKNLYTAYVTNGYMTPEALDEIGPYLDAWRVDVKGFSAHLYRNLAKINRWQGILDIAKRARQKWNMHVEVVTNVIPSLNDDDKQLEGIASWIKNDLGELTPWHVTRFYPQYHMTNLSPTPIPTLEKAIEIGKRVGLKFIYVGNVPGHPSENTVCYHCGRTVVERVGYNTRVVGLAGSKCSNCGSELNFRSSETKRRE